MGIGLWAAEYMARAVHDFGIGGSALTLGRQDVWINEKQFRELAGRVNWGNVDGTKVEFFDKARSARVAALYEKGLGLRRSNARYISDELLFAAMGFESLDSADANDFEGATVIHDFNRPGLADAAAARQFDFVFDGGTIEHVFHVPNMMRNIFDVVKVGGFVLHAAPSNNHCDHGFYQFSPTFFYDWYGANGWSIKRADFFKYAVSLDVPWEFTPYTPGSLTKVSFGGLDSALYGIMFCAQKIHESKWDQIPQQNYYVNKWPRDAAKEKVSSPDRGRGPSPASLGARLSRALRGLKNART
jgi:SAM-dependent methyltransferase